MKTKTLFFLSLFLIAGEFANAQFTQDDEDVKRWFVGGYIGAQFGDITLIDISPNAGYMLTKRIAIGLGVTYKFYRIKDFYDPFQGNYISFKSHITGGSAFSRFFVTRQFFAHTEYEYLSYNNQNYGKVDYQSIFVGGGYRQYVSANTAFEILLLYNLNETHNSPYNNPVIRMGISVGL